MSSSFGSSDETPEEASMIAEEEKGYPPTTRPRKLHTLTVCMVPPPEYTDIWDRLGRIREHLQDPGYFRWPPHVNLLYPFFDFKSQNTIMEVVQQLHSATKQCPPFTVSLNAFGTFGGKRRGVLWLYPDSSVGTTQDGNDDSSDEIVVLPMMDLHKKLEEAFPMCFDLSQKAGDDDGGTFSPHMTLSHFENLQDAVLAQADLISNGFNLDGLDFTMDRVYLLERQGDSGQFERLAEVGLGPDSIVTVFESPQAFPGMPKEEVEWVYEERMKLKARRNGGRGRGGGRGGGNNRRMPPREARIPDPPQVIEAKRAERKAKRERLEKERELLEIEQALKSEDEEAV
jgi:2'-5' RNA ligase